MEENNVKTSEIIKDFRFHIETEDGSYLYTDHIKESELIITTKLLPRGTVEIMDFNINEIHTISKLFNELSKNLRQMNNQLKLF